VWWYVCLDVRVNDDKPKNMNKLTFVLATLFLIAINSYAQTSTEEGYMNDPDGYTNVRKEQSSSSEIITTIKTGELFQFQS
jgi:uncharacterized protein YgiM (DUF1202 family)